MLIYMYILFYIQYWWGKVFFSFHVLLRSRTEISRSQCLGEMVWWFCFRLNDFKSSRLWSAIVFFWNLYSICKQKQSFVFRHFHTSSHEVFACTRKTVKLNRRLNVHSPFNCMCVGFPSTNQGWSVWKVFIKHRCERQLEDIRNRSCTKDTFSCSRSPLPDGNPTRFFVWWYLQKHGLDVIFASSPPGTPNNHL